MSIRKLPLKIWYFIDEANLKISHKVVLNSYALLIITYYMYI